MQVLVAGRGLVLETPNGEIDVRQPFKPVRFAGEKPIMSRLEAGPVEVVNLIGARARVRIDLQVLDDGAAVAASAGTHIAYAAQGPATLAVDGKPQVLAADHALRIEAAAIDDADLHERGAFAGERHMRIAVVGAGGVGGGFGAAFAKAGGDVTFIARGAHLAAMKDKGLKVESPRGDAHLVPTQATDDPASVGPVDIVLFCVKLWDVESAGQHIKPLIGPNTAVIPLQNGIDAPERLVPILGKQAVMGGVAQISASITAPGVIRQVGTFMRMIVRRARRLAIQARRGAPRALPEGRLRRDAQRPDPDRALDEVHPARHQCQRRGARPPTDRQTARRSRHAAAIRRRL